MRRRTRRMRPRPGGWGGGIVLTVAFVPGRMPRKAINLNALRSEGVRKPRNSGKGTLVCTERTEDVTKVHVRLGDGPAHAQVLVYHTTTVQEACTTVQLIVDDVKPGHVVSCLGLPGGALLPRADRVLDHLGKDQALLHSILAPVTPHPGHLPSPCVADLDSLMSDYLRTAMRSAEAKTPPRMMGRVPGFAVFGMGETNMR